MFKKNHSLRKTRMLKNSLIITLLFSLLLTSFPAYALASMSISNIFPAGSAELSDAVIVAEDTTKRGEFEKHYLLSDGSFIAVSYPEAVHYLSEKGRWEEVDNRLLLDRSSSRIVNGKGDFAVSFADRPTDNSLASLLHDGKTFSWGLSATKLENGKMTKLNVLSANKASIVSEETASLASVGSGSRSASDTSAIGKKVNDSEVFTSDKLTGKLGYGKLFEDAPELSVEYSVYHNKIEEDIFINAPTDLRSFSMNIQTDGLTARLNDNGSVDFIDEKGIMQYRIGIPYMEDANNAVLNDIEVSIEQNEDICIVTYTPNENWLTSEERAYPILLDPSITTREYNSNIIDTYVSEGDTANHSSEQRLYYGVKYGNIYRTYIKINYLPNIDATMPVLGATMQLNFFPGTTTGKTAQVYKASGPWDVNTITYANQPALLASNLLSTCDYNSSISYMTFNLTQDVTVLYDEFNAAVNYGYVVKYADESTINPDYNVFHAMDSTTTGQRPVITITYGYALPSSLTDGSVYSFENSGSLSYMTVHNGSDANDVNVYQQSVSSVSNLEARHKFKLEYIASTGGYYLRSMSSSGGTNRVLDIVKSGGYVNNGGNVQIYAPNDPLAQHWFIIGTGPSTFKIVPRTDMSLALTVCPGGDGSSSGTTTTSVGNIFVATYDDTNNYQQWRIRDENGNIMKASSQRILTGTYYLNNRSYGKYLHKSSTIAVNAVSGLIATYENTIRWKITHVGNDEYTIQSSDDLTRYLCSDSATSVALSSMSVIAESCLWKISTASGGGVLVQNVATQSYLKQTGTSSVSVTPTLGTPGTTDYDCYAWRLASTEYINNRELLSGFSINELILNKGETLSPIINTNPSNAIWANSSDFTYELSNTTGYSGTVAISEDNITGSTLGLARVKATHKVTGRTCTFVIYIDRYTYELINFFGFDSEVSLLIRDLYNRIDENYSSETDKYKAWVVSRVLSEFLYDDTTIYFGLLPINRWDDVAGSVTSPSNRKAYFVDTLGYSEAEYDRIEAALESQYGETQTSDFAHMQYSLAARLAYKLSKTGLISNIYTISGDENVSYLAGWLGDATLTTNGTTSFNNDDYMADLDAENLFREIDAGDDSITAINAYYKAIAVSISNNRATIFKTHLSYSTVESKVLSELGKTLDQVKSSYPDTYDFLMSLKDGLAERDHYEEEIE